MGSFKTRVYVKDKGVVIDDSSLVAKIKKKRGAGRFLIFGQKAKEMINREPKQIEVVRPIENGGIKDLEATEAVVNNYLKAVYEIPSLYPKIFSPRGVLAVGSMISEVQRRAYRFLFIRSGIRDLVLVPSGVAGALGVGFGINEKGGIVLIDVGAGKTEMSLVSMGGLVINKGIRVGGENFDEAIVNYLKMRYGVLVGRNSAEIIKINGGGVVRGRNLESNLPVSIKIGRDEIGEACALLTNKIIALIKEGLDEMPTEMTDEVLKRGLIMIGGGSKLVGLQKKIEEETKINCLILDDPDLAVIKGCGEILINKEAMERVLRLNGK